MKPYFLKRLVSYLIDLIIIFMLATFVTSFVPINDKTKQLTEEMTKTLENASNKESEIKKEVTKTSDVIYQLSRETVINSLITITTYILYFVVLPVYNNGQTLGKKVMKLKIKSLNGSGLTINNMLFREMILHSILFNIISTILVMILDKENFIISNYILSCIQMIFFVIIIIMIVIRNDGRGLHDIIGNTIVENEEV